MSIVGRLCERAVGVIGGLCERAQGHQKGSAVHIVALHILLLLHGLWMGIRVRNTGRLRRMQGKRLQRSSRSMDAGRRGMERNRLSRSWGLPSDRSIRGGSGRGRHQTFVHVGVRRRSGLGRWLTFGALISRGRRSWSGRSMLLGRGRGIGCMRMIWLLGGRPFWRRCAKRCPRGHGMLAGYRRGRGIDRIQFQDGRILRTGRSGKRGSRPRGTSSVRGACGVDHRQGDVRLDCLGRMHVHVSLRLARLMLTGLKACTSVPPTVSGRWARAARTQCTPSSRHPLLSTDTQGQRKAASEIQTGRQLATSPHAKLVPRFSRNFLPATSS